MITSSPIDLFKSFANSGKHYGLECMLFDDRFMNSKFVIKKIDINKGKQAMLDTLVMVVLKKYLTKTRKDKMIKRFIDPWHGEK